LATYHEGERSTGPIGMVLASAAITGVTIESSRSAQAS
jgi:hypothetical protein